MITRSSWKFILDFSEVVTLWKNKIHSPNKILWFLVFSWKTNFKECKQILLSRKVMSAKEKIACSSKRQKKLQVRIYRSIFKNFVRNRTRFLAPSALNIRFVEIEIRSKMNYEIKTFRRLKSKLKAKKYVAIMCNQ